jgi:hypothetical protein
MYVEGGGLPNGHGNVRPGRGSTKRTWDVRRGRGSTKRTRGDSPLKKRLTNGLSEDSWALGKKEGRGYPGVHERTEICANVRIICKNACAYMADFPLGVLKGGKGVA